MKPETFDEIVARRAHETVTRKIATFRNEVHGALMILMPDLPGYDSRDAIREAKPLCDGTESNQAGFERMCADMNLCIVNLQSGGRTWPTRIWEYERAQVKDAILKQLDIVQQAMLAPPIPDDGDKPHERSQP